ncbi:unnamed protein product, partial [Prunus brigantina]
MLVTLAREKVRLSQEVHNLYDTFAYKSPKKRTREVMEEIEEESDPTWNVTYQGIATYRLTLVVELFNTSLRDGIVKCLLELEIFVRSIGALKALRTHLTSPTIPDHFEDTIKVKDVVADSNVDVEVEDVAATHDSNVEVDAELTEPSQEREPLRSMLKTYTLREWNWWANPNNGIFKLYIQRSGLEQLIRCSYRNADKIVVSTFVER